MTVGRIGNTCTHRIAVVKEVGKHLYITGCGGGYIVSTGKEMPDDCPECGRPAVFNQQRRRKPA